VATAPEPRSPMDENRTSKSDDGTKPKQPGDNGQVFYERLEQVGQLVDVDADTVIAALPPKVTHIRYPDGTVERIGFSAAPYGV
jgi:hypothetical protein